LILVGDFLGEEFYYSKLYHKDFHHEFRKGLSSHAK
jgi:precorrin-4 methylase, putative